MFNTSMVSFISKKIEEENNIGIQLKSEREKKGMSLDMISIMIGIDAKYLKAFEESDFASLPEGIYRDKFFKKYAEFLNVGEKNMLLFPINESRGTQEELYNLNLDKGFLITKIKNFILSPCFLKNLLIFALLLCPVAYLYFIGYNIISPPKLTIIAPNDDFVTKEFIVGIKGQTEQEVKVFINDKEIYCMHDGDFFEELDLKKGINIVKISAKKKYSKENVVYRKILVIENNEIGLFKLDYNYGHRAMKAPLETIKN
ncbi:MAG: helix-turn-helix transcriptional regulator [bacterium]